MTLSGTGFVACELDETGTPLSTLVLAPEGDKVAHALNQQMAAAEQRHHLVEMAVVQRHGGAARMAAAMTA